MAVSAHRVQPTQHGIFCVLAPDQICNIQGDVLVLVVYSVSPTLEVSSTVHLVDRGPSFKDISNHAAEVGTKEELKTPTSQRGGAIPTATRKDDNYTAN